MPWDLRIGAKTQSLEAEAFQVSFFLRREATFVLNKVGFKAFEIPPHSL
jgi:hypothetical protein